MLSQSVVNVLLETISKLAMVAPAASLRYLFTPTPVSSAGQALTLSLKGEGGDRSVAFPIRQYEPLHHAGMIFLNPTT